MNKFLVKMFGLFLIILLPVLGICNRRCYTDYRNNSKLMDTLYVAALPEDLTLLHCNLLAENLNNVPYILQVTISNETEHLFNISQQQVRVDEVYNGEGISGGEDIIIFSDHWNLSLTNEPYSLERGFINQLKVGEKYLVFLSEKIETPQQSFPVYKFYDNAFIVPAFPYVPSENKLAPTTGDTLYVEYKRVKDNDFFGTTSAALAIWEKLRSDLISSYSIDGISLK